jgi:3-methyladenine DNA glycosylase AlkD
MEDKRFKELCDEALSTYIKKNTDYGNSFTNSINEFGIVAAVIRISDKMERIKSLIKKKENLVKDESLIDTFKDMANYCLMSIIELEKQNK